MSVTRTVSSTLALAGLTAVLAAQTPALDLKLGLWEQTTIMKMEGMPAGMGAQPMTERTCLTKEDLSNDSFMMQDQGDMKCKRTITANTRTTFAADIACTGPREVKGKLSVSATSSEAFTATMTMASSQGGRAVNMTMTTTGKFVGAACGNVK